MPENPKTNYFPLILAKLVCCGGLLVLLVASGTLTLGTFTAWFADDGFGWGLGGLAILAGIVVFLRTRMRGRNARALRNGPPRMPSSPI